MLIYLDSALKEMIAQHRAESRPLTAGDLYHAIIEGAVERVRPKMMMVVAIMASLLPILWSTGTGSEVMTRIAVPLVGGMLSSTILTLIVIPAICALVKGQQIQTAATISIAKTERETDRQPWPPKDIYSGGDNCFS